MSQIAKKLLIMVILIVLGLTVYIFLINPAIYDNIHLTIESSWLIQSELLDNNNVGNTSNRLNDNINNYRYVYITYTMHYLSPFKITSLVSYPDINDTKTSSLILREGYGGFLDGEIVPANWFNREVYGTRLLIYVGDCINDEQIKDKVFGILTNTSIKIRYRIQWIGVREDLIKIDTTKTKVDFLDYN